MEDLDNKLLVINDRPMYPHEIASAKQKLAKQKEYVKNFYCGSSLFAKEFKKYIELLITVRGHAWCMDVKSERNKLSRLITKTVDEFKRINICRCGHDERCHCISIYGKRTVCGATFSCRCKKFKLKPTYPTTSEGVTTLLRHAARDR